MICISHIYLINQPKAKKKLSGQTASFKPPNDNCEIGLSEQETDENPGIWSRQANTVLHSRPSRANTVFYLINVLGKTFANKTCFLARTARKFWE